MATLDTIVSVNITAETKTPSRASFGTPLILAYHTHNLDRVRTYTSLAAMVSDGFTVYEPAYRAAQAIFSQNPRVAKLKVGKRTNAPSQSLKLTTVTTTEGFTYRMTFTRPDGADVSLSYVVLASATTTSIATALASLINGSTVNVAATASGADITIVPDTASALHSVHGFGPELVLIDQSTDPGVAADLTACAVADSDWYGVVIDSQSEAEINATAAWVEASSPPRIFCCSNASTAIKTSGTTDVASDLKTASIGRTCILFHENPLAFAGAAMLGNRLPHDPGTDTWAFKTLAGVKVSALSQSEQDYIEGKNANITLNGKARDGTFMDQVRGTDWLQARIQEAVFQLIVASEKLPYTDASVDAVRAAILGVLGEGVRRGFLAADPEPTCTAPRVADVSAGDKGNRLLPDVEFEARLAGALHGIVIAGRLVL
jgi:hypothetical protein